MVLDCKFLNTSGEKFNKNMRFFAGFRMTIQVRSLYSKQSENLIIMEEKNRKRTRRKGER